MIAVVPKQILRHGPACLCQGWSFVGLLGAGVFATGTLIPAMKTITRY